MAHEVLVKLSESGQRIVPSDADIRGRTVRDSDGETIGTVDDLLIDSEEDTVRCRSGPEKVAGAPGYDPELIPDHAFHDQIYGYTATRRTG